MSLYANRIHHRDRFEAYERAATVEAQAVDGGSHGAHVLAYYMRRGAAHYCAWRVLVLADQPPGIDPASVAGRLSVEAAA